MSFHICARKKPKILLTEKGRDVLKIKDNLLSVYQTQKRYDQQEGYSVHNFHLDKVFGEKDDNDLLYNELFDKNVIDTYSNIFLFTYGETGTGKTHTIFGNNREAGLFQLLTNSILRYENINELSGRVFEIYNDKIYDLLNNRKSVILRENGNAKFCLKGCKKTYITNTEDVKDIENKIQNDRVVGETCFNSRSSRSHAIVQLLVERDNMETQKITIVDLAGSEKASNSIYRDNVLYRENSSINRNLLALKECIRSTYMKNSHIPFRNCTLTKVLRSMFQKSSYTIMISTISSGEKMCKSTLDTLKYASYIKKRNPDNTSKVMKKREINKERDDCIKKLDKAKKVILYRPQNPVDLLELGNDIDKFLEKL